MSLTRMWTCAAAVLALAGVAAAQPANDDCSTAEDLTSASFPMETTPADVLLANPTVEATLCVGAGYSVWYKITPTLAGQMTMQTCPAQAPGCTISDTVVGLFESADGTCNTLTRIACNDDACGLRSITSANVNAGTTYYIQVAKYGSGAPTLGADKLSVYVTAPTPPPPPPANDDCTAATDLNALTLPAETTPTSVLAGNPTLEYELCVGASYSLWYKYAAGASGTMSVETCAASAPGCSVGDTVLGVYESADGTCGSLTGVACNDDSDCGLRSYVEFNVVAGRTYYIQLAKYGGVPPAAGLDMLSMYVSALTPTPPAPANDACADSIDVGTSFPTTTAAVNVRGAAASSEADQCAPGGYSVWYRITPTQSASYLFSTCATAAPECTVDDTIVSIYSGACGSLTEIACGDDTCGARGRAEATLTAGVTYYVQVSAGGSGPGLNTNSVSMQVSILPPSFVESADAGDLTTSAAVAAGSGSLGRISGNLDFSDTDMFLISICDPASFSASTDDGNAAFDTQLFLFNTSGIGVTFNDDNPSSTTLQSYLGSSFIPGPGNYYLAVSAFDHDPVDEAAQAIWLDTPYDVERTPDGPGAAGALAAWTGSGGGGAYVIALTGACFVGGPSCGSADFNGDGDVGTDADIEAFFACLAGNCCGTCGSADFNADGDTGTDSDIEAFFRVLAGGTC